VLGGELIDRVVQNEHLITLILILLQDGRALDGVKRVTGKVENSVLVFLHAGDVLIKRDPAVGLLSGVEPNSKKQILD
jgi:hypothetical protein